MRTAPARSVAQVDSFITMLLVACEDAGINARLERLLSLPDERRRAIVHTWVSELLIAQAPPEFVAAIACLIDDRVAEQAYTAIHRCSRDGRNFRLPPPPSRWRGYWLRGGPLLLGAVLAGVTAACSFAVYCKGAGTPLPAIMAFASAVTAVLLYSASDA